MIKRSVLGLLALMVVATTGGAFFPALIGGVVAKDQRPRLLVSTDIGGTDPDDFQSMVHLLVCADRFDLEGLVSSPYGPGRRSHLLEVIDRYEHDYPNLKSHSPGYPAPEYLRSISKQGALDGAGRAGFGAPTEGSRWIVNSARRQDSRPLHILVWGGIDDLAQALHDAPDIVPRLRVYWIGGPNKMWSVDAYDYIERNHPKLWMIEANSTYRGWFVGGDQSGEWGNQSFVAAHIAGHGALGDFFNTQLKGVIKMGDSPSVGWLLRGDSANPRSPGWGGSFVPIWDGRKSIFERLTTAKDQVEAFGVVEFSLLPPADLSAGSTVRMIFDNRITVTGEQVDGRLLFRFSPRDAKLWPYVIRSDFAGLDGKSGSFTAIPPPIERTRLRSKRHPNWWTDDPDPAAAEGIHAGARSVNRWRVKFLRDFAERMERCNSPKSEPR